MAAAQREASYTKLIPCEEADAQMLTADKVPRGAAKMAARTGTSAYKSTLNPGRGEEILGSPQVTLWTDRILEFRRRKAGATIARAVRPRRRWRPQCRLSQWCRAGEIGRHWDHRLVLDGQAVGFPSVAGRVSGIAIAPGGQIVYVASANGGVFRSDDAGMTWTALMDGFDVDPTNFASTSLACGAIAIDPGDPNRVYVGTGEGDTDAMFNSRIINALPAYRGIGPIRSDDGGQTWVRENVAAGSANWPANRFSHWRSIHVIVRT